FHSCAGGFASAGGSGALVGGGAEVGDACAFRAAVLGEVGVCPQAPVCFLARFKPVGEAAGLEVAAFVAGVAGSACVQGGGVAFALLQAGVAVGFGRGFGKRG